MQNSTPQNAPMSEDTKTIITVLLLITVTPVGFVLMWVWTSWKNSIKWLVTILGCLPIIIFLGIMIAITISSVNEQKRIQMMNESKIYPTPVVVSPLAK